jgi:hypothetical protein
MYEKTIELPAYNAKVRVKKYPPHHQAHTQAFHLRRHGPCSFIPLADVPRACAPPGDKHPAPAGPRGALHARHARTGVFANYIIIIMHLPLLLALPEVAEWEWWAPRRPFTCAVWAAVCAAA